MFLNIIVKHFRNTLSHESNIVSSLLANINNWPKLKTEGSSSTENCNGICWVPRYLALTIGPHCFSVGFSLALLVYSPVSWHVSSTWWSFLIKTYLLRLSRLFKILSFLLCILKSIYMSLFLAFSYDHTTHLVQAQLQDGYKWPKTLKIQDKRLTILRANLHLGKCLCRRWNFNAL